MQQRIIVIMCVSFLLLRPKYLKRTTWEREDLFWLTVSEDSLQGWPAPRQRRHGGKAWQREGVHGSQEAEEERGTRDKMNPPGHSHGDLLAPDVPPPVVHSALSGLIHQMR